MKKKIICAVAGKNIKELGNGKSETYYKNLNIKLSIMERISELITNGVTDFLCNAEYGFNLWTAEIILTLRDMRIQQGLGAVRLHIVQPYEEQAAEWSDDIHERYYAVCEKADSVFMLYTQFRDDCYEKCDRFMIDNCDILFTDDENAFAAQYAEIHDKPLYLFKELERI